MIDLTPIINAIIAIIAAVITAFLVPLIRRKLTASQLSELAVWVETAVKAAEQIIKGTEMGTKRKEWVLERLREHGYDLDDEETLAQIEMLIEAFVLELKQNA